MLLNDKERNLPILTQISSMFCNIQTDAEIRRILSEYKMRLYTCH